MANPAALDTTIRRFPWLLNRARRTLPDRWTDMITDHYLAMIRTEYRLVLAEKERMKR